METPPSTSGPHRLNYMQFRRGEEEQSSRHQLLSKFGPKYHFYKKEAGPQMAQRENITKIMTDMKKHIAYLQNTKWMFENNEEMNPSEHLSHNNL